MKERLLQLLVCPFCRSYLTIEAGYCEKNEIIEGILGCPCGEIFPIINGVPFELGAEIGGVDVSQAGDPAYHNNVDNQLVHIVQADIYNLPFKPGIFHFIYSCELFSG